MRLHGVGRPKRCVWALAVSLFAALVPAASAQTVFQPHDSAVLRGLDKVTARVSTIQAPVGAVMHFGSLSVIARTCRKTPEEETPEAAAYLVVQETKPDGSTKPVFEGWMFASSPALSAMDHAVYDIWLLDCIDTSATAESTAPGGSSE